MILILAERSNHDADSISKHLPSSPRRQNTELRKFIQRIKFSKQAKAKAKVTVRTETSLKPRKMSIFSKQSCFLLV